MVSCVHYTPYAMTRLLLLTALCLAGCSFTHDDDSFAVDVQRLDVPEQAQVGEPFEVRAHYALTNGCLSFDRIDAKADGDRIVLTVYAVSSGASVCTTDVRGGEGVYRITPRQTGPLVVDATARHDAEIARTVQVVP